MKKTVNKTILTIDALNILAWIENPDGIMAKIKLPIKVMWSFKDNIKVLSDIRDKFNEFNAEIEQKYSDDEYSFDCTEKDETVVRRVKDEFIKEFNKEKYDLLTSENKVSINLFDIEDFGDIDVDVQDMNILSLFILDEE